MGLSRGYNAVGVGLVDKGIVLLVPSTQMTRLGP